MSSPALTMEGVTLGYPATGRRTPERIVASGVSLRFAEGELSVVLGANGGGKSTLLRTLSGLQTPLAGEVRLGDIPLSRFSSRERAKRVAVVLTERTAPPGVSAAALVSLGRHPHTGWLGGMTEEDHRRVHWALEATDTLAFAERPANELSDGERQRVWIARALAQDARILVLDEPTAFLDLPHRVEILRLLRRLAHASGFTVVLSTHDVEHALRLADRLVLLSSAGVVAGAPEDLVLAGAMNQLFPSPEVHFDLQRAQFRIREETRGHLRVNAPEALANWVRHVAERAGWAVGPESEIVIEASSDPHGSQMRWGIARPGAARLNGETAAELYRALASEDFITREK